MIGIEWLHLDALPLKPNLLALVAHGIGYAVLDPGRERNRSCQQEGLDDVEKGVVVKQRSSVEPRRSGSLKEFESLPQMLGRPVPCLGIPWTGKLVVDQMV
jgi:hypothetical protein